MRIEKITHKKNLVAVIVRAKKLKPGVHFFTAANESVQLGLQKRKNGSWIRPHLHPTPQLSRAIPGPMETLYIIKGKLKVIFYTPQKQRIASRILKNSDLLIQKRMGHSFEILADTEFLEIRSGPFTQGHEGI